MHPGIVGESRQLPLGIDPPHVRLGGIFVGSKDHAVADVEHLGHMETDRGHQVVVERQPLRVVGIHRSHQPTVGEPGGDADGDVEPTLVVVLADDFG